MELPLFTFQQSIVALPGGRKKRQLLVLILALISSGTAFSQATITGAVAKGRDSLLSFVRTENNVTGRRDGTRYTVQVGSDGRFKITVPETGVGEWRVEGKGRIQRFHLVKGKTYELQDAAGKAHFSAVGENADEFNYVAHCRARIDTSFIMRKDHQNGLLTKNIDSALKIRKEEAAYEQQVLADYRKTHAVSDIYYRWLQSKYRYAPYYLVRFRNIGHNAPVSSAQMDLLMENGIDDDYAALNTEEYAEMVNSCYLHYKLNGMKYPVRIVSLFDLALGNALKGITKEVALTRIMTQLAMFHDSLFTPAYEKYNIAVQNPQLKEGVDIARNAYLEKNGMAGRRAGLDRSSPLQGIFSKYSGKVVYIDFWGSWCGPCLAAMPYHAGLRKKLAGKDVVFLYLGYRDKEAPWLAARKTHGIEGEHVLLNDEQIREVNQVFRIMGVPHYAILDKQGNIASCDAEGPSQVYTRLLKLAGSK